MKKALVYCLVLLLSPAFLWAQISNNTSLVGTVLDSTGSAVSGAKVTAVEQSTKLQYSATTNESGYYAITFIQGGAYDITVEQPGFGKVTTTGVPVTVNMSVRTDFNLKIGATTDTVTVLSASTPPLSTDDASLGETFAPKQVEDLPVQGHNALEIAALASNVIIGSEDQLFRQPSWRGLHRGGPARDPERAHPRWCLDHEQLGQRGTGPPQHGHDL